MGISNYDKKSENMLNVFRLFVFWGIQYYDKNIYCIIKEIFVTLHVKLLYYPKVK